MYTYITIKRYSMLSLVFVFAQISFETSPRGIHLLLLCRGVRSEIHLFCLLLNRLFLLRQQSTCCRVSSSCCCSGGRH